MHVAGLFLTLSAVVASVSASTVHPASPVVEQDTPCPTMPPMPEPEDDCKVLKNMDRPGFDLKAVKAPRKLCMEACENTAGCRTWAWSDYEGGTCWLKKRASEPVWKAGVWTTECQLDATTTPTTPTTPSDECKPLKNVDFAGNDIANKPAKNFGQCCGICNAYSGCKAYAWSDFNGGTCWLKAGVTTAVYKEGVVSASTVELHGPVCPFEYDTDFVANDIGNKPAKNAGECCAICKGHKECKAYSWSNYQGGTCWMKSGKGATIKAAGVISAKLVGN